MTTSTMKMRTLVLALLATGLAQSAWAEGGSSTRNVPLLPLYTQECAACHVAFPSRLLPAASWQRLMGRLDKHFGTDASLDAAAAQQIGAWLASNAASGQRATTPPPEDRITRSAWFVREHDEVPAASWKLAAVKSAANCAACHTRADQGDYSERSIRIPR